MNGILAVDKPEGWTSHDVVAKLRGVLHEKRIGHSGTLDPMATGVLVVFAGRATRAVEYAEADKKTYVAGILPGVVTDTLDRTGTVLSSHEVNPLPEDEIWPVLKKFQGEICQVPPMYSAVKMGGEALYKKARRGETVERKERRVTIYDLHTVPRPADAPVRGNAEFFLSVTCSKGTYIRTLADDIGSALGCGACMSYLRRMQAGAFSVEETVKMEEILSAESPETLLRPVDSLFRDLPELVLTAPQEKCIRNGSSFTSGQKSGRYRAYAADGEFIGLVSCADGILKTEKTFCEMS